MRARDLKIVAHALSGKRPMDIASAMGVSRDVVKNVLTDARSCGIQVPYFRKNGVPRSDKQAPDTTAGNYVAVPLRLQPLLRSEAARLGKSEAELARDTLERGLLEGWARNG